MKKIYTIALATLFSGSMMAQAGKAEIKETKTITNVNIKGGNNSKTPTDTTGWSGSGNFLPDFAVGGQVVFYSYTGGGYVYGNNKDGVNYCAQGYTNLTGGDVNVEGVLLWFGAKYNNDQTSSMSVEIWEMAANSALNDDGNGSPALVSPGPSVMKGSETLLLSAADTAWPNITPLTFTNPVQICGGVDFAIAVNTADLASKGDTVGLISDQNGEGMEYAFHNYNGSWYVTNFLFGGNLNNNIALFAVVDANYVCAGTEEYMNGVQLSTYPNPATDQITISFGLQKSFNKVNVSVVDVTGKMVKEFNYSSMNPGVFNETLDVSNLPAGTYFYFINADGSRLAKKFVVTK
ncbi:MAG TPA: hypothetical protein DIU39_02945 [Flavobacteriales bacterium]|nr:hypothetical protein [Flavobacteriales bacterium]|tara:strand:- start:52429 stop:53475 length:1047 start_codon:yes stop_codon:yes gene_type:complete